MEPPTPITTNMELLPSQDHEISSTTISNQRPSSHPQIQYDPSKGIRTPAPADVICGRGKMTIAHLGNRRFRQAVMDKKDEYQKAIRRDDKTRITFELVQNLRNGPEGGR
jgi:hypothetical protein